MTDDTANLVLEQLRAIRATLGEHSAQLAKIESTIAEAEALRTRSRKNFQTDDDD